MPREIGLIQIRTGKQRNLPKALELGEMGFTTDECRVFVGLPSMMFPASLVAGRTKTTVPGSGEENVEILTEFTPEHVLSRVLFKATKFDIPKSTWKAGETSYISDEQTIKSIGSFLISIPASDRLFVEYTAYSISGNRVLETGSIQVISVQSDTLLTQQNNTSDPNSNIFISAASATLNGSSTKILIENRYNQDMRFEYIYRGWQEPI